MPTIYTNAFIHNDPALSTENLPTEFSSCAKELERVAKEYKKLAKFLEEKNINIQATEGYSFSGSFVVDEIDAGRLMQAGLVVDLEKDEQNKTCVFYIDKKLDQVLKDSDHKQEMLDKLHEQIEAEEDLSEVSLIQAQTSIEDDPGYKEGTFQYSINDLNHPHNEEKFMKLDSRKTEDSYIINFDVEDPGTDPLVISFNRTDNLFKYKCTDCDEWHQVELNGVFRNLTIAAALLTNLANCSIPINKYLATTLGAIADDLRLLKHLIRFDYAIPDESGK